MPADLPPDRCDGSYECPVAIHIHGCYADTRPGICDDPGDHDRLVAGRPIAIAITVSQAEQDHIDAIRRASIEHAVARGHLRRG